MVIGLGVAQLLTGLYCKYSVFILRFKLWLFGLPWQVQLMFGLQICSKRF